MRQYAALTQDVLVLHKLVLRMSPKVIFEAAVMRPLSGSEEPVIPAMEVSLVHGEELCCQCQLPLPVRPEKIE